MTNINDYKDQRIHFIGIGGCSMSGLALILKGAGFEVSGSDQKKSSFTEMLRKNGIEPTIGHDAKNVEGAGLVIYSAAIKPTNPEYAAAEEADIPMLERSKLLGVITRDYPEVVAIAGCHGKTTITSMLALILEHAELDPTVHVGGMVDKWGGGVRVGKSDIFVTEACEYVKSFLTLHPKYALINNIDDDHLDCYRDILQIRDTFIEFTDLLPQDGILFINKDDDFARSVRLFAPCQVVTYGQDDSADFYPKNMTFDENGCPSFDVYNGEDMLGHVALNVPGLHNAMNALAALTVAFFAYIVPVETSAEALEDYQLAERRFQFFGEKNGVSYYHDYAHHPTEIMACLAAAKLKHPRKLWAVFQCNSYTRARTLKNKYGKAFFDADTVLLPDIYWGRDTETGGMTVEQLYDAIQRNSGNCVYLPTFEEIRDYLDAHAQPGDMVVTLGSGDVNKQQLKLLK